MAYTLQLTDGTTTIDLHSATYRVMGQSLDFGWPGDVRSEAASLFRDGWDLVAQRWTKRTISMR